MRKIENINWNIEREFPNIDEMKNEPYCADDCWEVAFDWNGYKLIAKVDFWLDLETTPESGGSGGYDGEDVEEITTVNVTEASLELKELYDLEGDLHKVDSKEFHEIQAQLLTELNILV